MMKKPKLLISCNKQLLFKMFPILTWLPKYNTRKLKSDIIASLAVSLMVIPQSLALASIAELPPESGLYTAFPGGFMYCIFGTSKDINIGPTVIGSILTDRYNSEGNTLIASTLTFICGVVLLCLGIFQLGFVIQFIPTPVLGGFISAAAITIAVSQLKYIFGLKNVPRFFLSRVAHFFSNIQHTNPWDVTLGLTCLLALIGLQVISKKKWRERQPKTVLQVVLKNLLITLVVARGVIVVVFSTLISYLFHIKGYKDSFTLAVHMPPGLPTPQVSDL